MTEGAVKTKTKIKSMKSTRSISGRAVLAVLAVLTLIAVILGLVLMPEPLLRAQNAYGTNVYQPNFFNVISNYNNLWVPSNAGTVNFTTSNNQTITIRQNTGDGWSVCIACTNTVSGNATLFFDVNDGSASNNWTGAANYHYLTWTIPLLSSSTNIYATNFGRDVVNNFRTIYPMLVSNSITGQDYQIQFLHETHANN